MQMTRKGLGGRREETGETLLASLATSCVRVPQLVKADESSSVEKEIFLVSVSKSGSE